MHPPALDVDAVNSVLDDLESGKTQTTIAHNLGVSKTVITKLLRGKSYACFQPLVQRRLAEIKAANAIPEGTKRCTKCKEVKPATQKYFQPLTERKQPFEARCLVCKAATQRTRYYDARMAALRHYSGGDPKCSCCGEAALEFLTIDHINGGGSAHRREFRGRFSSIGFALRNEGYPDGYRVLCMNCNSSLGFHGYCPHQQ